jgi:two-component system chemotaxis sensor kinase CheA
MNSLDDVIKDFLVESHENLDRMDQDLVALEKDPRDRDKLASIFRTIHTIKGTCGFFAFARLGAVTHAGENLLSRLRDGQLGLTPEVTTGLLTLVDTVRNLLATIESTGREGDGDYTTLIGTLNRLQRGPGAVPPPQPAGPPLPRAAEAGTDPAGVEGTAPDPVTDDFVAASLSEGNVRVSVGLLDKLMNLVGELVLARNRILQFTATQKDPAFVNTTQRLNLITTELQAGVMKTRMQPIGTVWNKFPRLARDLALACGKQVRIDLEGQETELDRSIIEAIKDPLTHLVRNAIDHGLEPPEVRRARGKPAEGHLVLRAFHESGQVNIEIADDGAGIDRERVKHKALQRGLITADQAGRLGDHELLHLVFRPGFSTADQVTSVSGRGVGMDVVKTNIEKVGGTVDLDSRPGQGTAVKIKIPLTLAIIPALLVSNGGDRYAIPQVNLLELVRLGGEAARRRVERFHGTPVYRLRGNLLPLVDLGQELKVDGQAPRPEATWNIVVLQAGGRPFGLVVEAVHDSEEIVVKPLGKWLKDLPLFAGATILGDGRVALILDVPNLARSAGMANAAPDGAGSASAALPVPAQDTRQTLLLFEAGKTRRLAMPLSLLSRLEEFPRSEVEQAAGQEAVQYRGGILPLFRLGRLLGESDSEPTPVADPLRVVVFSGQGRTAGLVVDQILDIVESTVEIQPCAGRTGILGSAVIQQRVTDLLDLPGLLRTIDPALFEPPVAV